MHPAQIGRYEIKEIIGQGGMGMVYQGYDPRFRRDVAIKVLPRHLLDNPALKTRFEREARTVAALEHPAIVSVYDFDEENGQPFLVMQLMPGGTLAERLQAGPLPIDEVVRIMRRIGSALDEAHKQGVVHRDLKPANILFDRYGNAYLTDFGIVRLAESQVDLTGTGTIGTPGYMAPEQIQGQTVDSRTDVYALGVLVFEMLTGRKPFSGDTPAMILVKQMTEPAPDLRQYRPDLPDNLEEVVERALSKEKEQRPATAGEIAQLLAAAAEATSRAAEQLAAAARAAQATPPTPLEETVVEETSPPPAATVRATLPEPPASPAPVPIPAAATPKPAARRRLPMWAIGAAGLALIVVLGLGILAAGLAARNARNRPVAEDGVTRDNGTGVTVSVGDGEGDGDGEEGTESGEPELAASLDRGYFYLDEEQDYERALEIANALIEQNDDDPSYYQLRGYAHRALGETAEALADFTTAHELYPEEPQYLLDRVITYDIDENYEAAIADANLCIEIAPEYDPCYFHLGILYQLEDDQERAREAWLQAVEINPDNFDALRELAWLGLWVDGDPHIGLEYADRAVAAGPDDASSYYARGFMQRELGNFEAALEDFSHYLGIVEEWECLECQEDARVFVAVRTGELAPAVYALFFNPQAPPFDDLRVRQAFGHAIDRYLVAERVSELGLAGPEPLWTWVHPDLLRLQLGGEVGLVHDAELANQLLAEAGFPGGEGFPPVTLVIPEGPGQEMIAAGLRDLWLNVLGVDVAVEVDARNYFGRIANDPPGLFRLGYIASRPEQDAGFVLREWFYSGAGSNLIGYANPEFDRLLDQAAGAEDEEQRRQLYIEADRIISEVDAVILPLFSYYASPQ